MPTDSESDLQFEIGHVLFIDIVGYSKLLITEQGELLRKLTGIVRETEAFRRAEDKGQLVRIPTGDGMALVFRSTTEAPVQCAVELSKSLQAHPELPVRMGVHSGPVNEVTDVNERTNITGAGINVAQRVMDCGDVGHILLSKHVADDLEQYPRWRPLLHELGECEVKHGMRLGIVNFYSDQIGNSALPEKVKTARAKLSARPVGKLAVPQGTRMRNIMIALATLCVLFIASWMLYDRIRRYAAPTKQRESASAVAKSIAVLPFTNLSGNPENAYFAAGIQDEIVTRLAKITELKVISCTSTQRFKSAPDDLPAIAKQLGVANILEGSVQRTADEVRVNVQLIRPETATHLWADTFDRKLTDIFAVESEIARTIAETMRARLSGSEEHAILVQPTANVEAHQLYLQGPYLWNRRTGKNLKKALAYFQQATEKDPNYALAYAGIADTYAVMPAYSAGSPQECLPRAQAAAEGAGA